MYLAYRLVLYLLFPVVILRLLGRGFRNRNYWSRWSERFGFIPENRRGPYRAWVHAVSVGEVKAASPILEILLENFEGQPVLVTTMTPTGAMEVEQLFGHRVDHLYLPYDYPGVIRRFLKLTAPQVAIIMETEIWPNLIEACFQQKLPVVYTNVRLSERSFQGYRRFGRLTGQALSRVDRFAVQSSVDAERIIALGAEPTQVTVTGSVKFDIRRPASIREVAEALRRELGWERNIWVAGSTHEGEEEQLLEAYRQLHLRFPDLLLVIVPRHPERFTQAYRLAKKGGFEVRRHSEQRGALKESIQIYIGDTMGELAVFLAAADVAFIGGSLVATGGHNILEVSAAGVPVIFGPYMFNFQEIATITLDHNAGVQVKDGGELADRVGDYLSDPESRDRAGEAGRKMVEENRGAVERVLAVLEPYLHD